MGREIVALAGILLVACGLSPDPGQARSRNRATRLLRWRGQVIAEVPTPTGWRYSALPAGSGTGMQVVEQIAGDRVVTLADGSGAIVERNGGHWLVPGPQGSRPGTDIPWLQSDSSRRFRMTDDGARFVVADAAGVHILEAGSWNHISYDTCPKGSAVGIPSSLVLLSSQLVAGFDRGEWGGGIAVLDLVRGTCSEIAEPLRLPVRQCGLDIRGRVWCAEGIAHGGSRLGRLRVREKTGEWRVALAAGGLERLPEVNWGRRPTSFEGVAFDSTGSTFVLTGRDGIVRSRLDGSWMRVASDPALEGARTIVFEPARGALAVAMKDGRIGLWAPDGRHLGDFDPGE